MAAGVKRFVALTSSLILLACTNSMNLEVTTSVPKAAMEPSNTRVSLVMSPAFTTYIYRENSEARENWEVKLGNSQSELFRSIFESAFGSVMLSHDDNNLSHAELIFLPRLTEMQLATPAETGFSFFEAWLKYDITMRSAASGDVRTINVTAYGKQNTARFQRRHEGLHKALESALRDAGAKLTIALIAITNER